MKHAHFFLELDYMLTVRSFGMFQGHLPPLLFLRKALDVQWHIPDLSKIEQRLNLHDKTQMTN